MINSLQYFLYNLQLIQLIKQNKRKEKKKTNMKMFCKQKYKIN
jgi:hypothetical protein